MPRNVAKKPPGGRRVSSAESFRRLRFIEDLMLDGVSRAQILLEANSKFGIADRTVDDYIRKVRDSWIEDAESNRDTRRAETRRRLLATRREMVAARAWNPVLGVERLLADVDGARGGPPAVESFESSPAPAKELTMEEAIDQGLFGARCTFLMIRQMSDKQQAEVRAICEAALRNLDDPPQARLARKLGNRHLLVADAKEAEVE